MGHQTTLKKGEQNFDPSLRLGFYDSYSESVDVVLENLDADFHFLLTDLCYIVIVRGGNLKDVHEGGPERTPVIHYAPA
jgi:hypothetical protein